ncbi:MAG: hypothetical protein M4579_004037 [Chaenotheca gracillima]|nr:MAG: hypothetical protein M4579_004037 [Chaenotheca gracillima]
MTSRQHGEMPKPWYNLLTIDLLFRVLSTTFFHPFVAWMVPLCLRAQGTPYDHTSMRVTIIYASSVSLFALLSIVNQRVAFGKPREVDLTREVIVITGGASGLGLLVAEVYGMRGASVAVLDVQDMDTEGDVRGVDFYRCDVGDRAQVEKAASEIEEDLGTPTILINNAGVVNGKPLLELSAEQIERNFRVNLLSHFHTLQTFLPGMIRQNRGTIVTVSSVLGRLGCRNLSDYTAAKAGLIAMHTSLVAELPPSSNIKTILVTPGQLSTSLFAGVQTPSNFFGPVLEPVDVAKEIIRAVDDGRSALLAMPLYSRWVFLLGVLPVGVQRLIRKACGVDKAMEGFVGNAHDFREEPKAQLEI